MIYDAHIHTPSLSALSLSLSLSLSLLSALSPSLSLSLLSLALSLSLPPFHMHNTDNVHLSLFSAPTEIVSNITVQRTDDSMNLIIQWEPYLSPEGQKVTMAMYNIEYRVVGSDDSLSREANGTLEVIGGLSNAENYEVIPHNLKLISHFLRHLVQIINCSEDTLNLYFFFHVGGGFSTNLRQIGLQSHFSFNSL